MHGHALGQRLAHQLVAGVGHQRRARVADQRDPRLMAQPCDQLGPLAGAIVVVIGGQRLGDAVDGKQLRRDRVSSAAMTSQPASTSSARKVMSRALPMGVAVT
ncbi:MAG: hypothetical protein WDM81_00135 [Rhizomicrobium sp.]